MRLLSLFSGIGAFEKALDRAGIKYDLVNYCEIDRYASRAYAAVHEVSEDLNLHDVQTIDCDRLKSRGVNLITYGFPCQDISVAGSMKGFEHDGQKTRSGLFYDALRVIRELQPEVAIAENVKALASKKFEGEFAAVRGGLAEAGYNNYYAILDASNYGIPQHRERIFIVSIRKDVDSDTFAFPQKTPLRLRVKDFLEPKVEEKYYINTDRARELIRKLAAEGRLPERGMAGKLGEHETDRVWTENAITQSLKSSDYKNPVKIALKQIGETGPHQTDRVYDAEGCCRTLKATEHIHPMKIVLKQIGEIGSCQSGRIYDSDGCCPTLNTAQGGQKQPKIIDVTGCKAVGDLKVGGERGIVYDAEKTMCTLSATQYKDPHKIFCNYRIRKLTPKECWRLMGFDDADFEKAKAAGMSNTQLYKQAGNSICVPVLTAIFRQLYQR